MGKMAGLSLALLGPFQAALSGKPLGKFRTNKVQALLIYLVSEAAFRSPTAHRREALMELLWPGLPTRSAQDNLRQTLYQLRKAIPESASPGNANDPFLLADRQTVQLNPAFEYELDLSEFLGLLKGDPSLAQLEQAVALYRGDFLADFYLPDSVDFEDWAAGRRAGLRRQVLGALAELGDRHIHSGDHSKAEEYARRQLEIDPLLESGHWQLLSVYQFTGRRSAALNHFENYRQRMASELGVAPGSGITALVDRIRKEELSAAALELHSQPDAIQTSSQASSPVPFVARRRELDQLQLHLQAALGGQAGIVFVTGEAGMGKTALLNEFARQAQASIPGLVAVKGICNALTGSGHPYLPFRDILGLLCGDLESGLAGRSVTDRQVRRLHTLAPYTLHALIEAGPGLVNVFVSGDRLLRNVATSQPAGSSLVKRLEELANHKTDAPAGGDQRQLFEQYTQVLRRLSQQRPLLLMLDDLQWVDGASTALLFHLVRRLEGSRVLVLGAYRPSEVASGRFQAGPEQEKQHALETMVTEFKRRFGDIQIDLDRFSPSEGREFVNAYLDHQANSLDDDFRLKLFWRTKGHPLYTVELLRDMQERGDLVKDQEGRWIQGSSLNWEALPARVEAVIQQRMSRLDPALLELLATASVEGEVFTAQVITRILKLDDRIVLKNLSQELEKRQGLVREEGEIQAGEKRLLRYRFGHVLFREYLYQQLSLGERRWLHGEMAASLQDLYRGSADEIALSLAHHYAAAGQDAKAVTYLLEAGDQARALYANQQAVDHYHRAIGLLKELGDYEKAAQTLMKLGLAYHTAFDFENSRQAYQEGFALWQRIGRQPKASLPSAPHPLRLVWQEPSSLDPTMGGMNLTAPLVTQLFSGLVAQSPEMEVVPDVAQSWEVLEDGRKYIFHLRDDVYWSDGHPVTAADFEFTFIRALDPATNAPVAGLLLYGIKNAREFNQGLLADSRQVGISALDETTLVFELEEPTSYFMQDISYYVLLPVPRHVVEQHASAWAEAENIVTNGPFRLVEWQRGHIIRLERNPAYHGRIGGNVQDVELFLRTNALDQLQLYADDQVDLVYNWFILASEMDELCQRHPGEHHIRPRFGVYYFWFNLSRPPFTDRRVRRAFALAIDRASLSEILSRGYEPPATGGFVPAGMPGHAAGIDLPYDPEQARTALAEAGYPGGLDFPAVTLATHPIRQSLAEYLQEQWRRVLNVKVSLHQFDPGSLSQISKTEPVTIYTGGWWADYADPDNFLRVDVHLDAPDWRNEAYERILERARRITDQDERMKLYQQADQILIEEAVIVPLIYSQMHLMLKPWVRYFPTTAIKNPGFWKDVIIDPH